LARLHEVANAPIFSYDESFFGREIVGGPLLLVADTSRQAAAVAIRILGGEKPGDIKIPAVQFGRPMFDWREMKRWGISESRLPPGSEIFFRDPTAWDRYQSEILAICALLFVQVSAITQFDGAVCGAFEGQACGTAVPIWPDFPIPVSGRCRDAGKRNWEVGAWAPVSW
jgi:hypothetical protein